MGVDIKSVHIGGIIVSLHDFSVWLMIIATTSVGASLNWWVHIINNNDLMILLLRVLVIKDHIIFLEIIFFFLVLILFRRNNDDLWGWHLFYMIHFCFQNWYWGISRFDFWEWNLGFFIELLLSNIIFVAIVSQTIAYDFILIFFLFWFSRYILSETHWFTASHVYIFCLLSWIL